MMPPSWTLGAMAGFPPPPQLDPPVAVRMVSKLQYANLFHDTVSQGMALTGSWKMCGRRSVTDPVVPPVSGGTAEPTTAWSSVSWHRLTASAGCYAE